MPAVEDERAFLRAFGRRLRVYRAVAELSQQQLAHRAGMSRNFVSATERGVHGVDLLRVRRLALALDVNIHDLLPATKPSQSSGSDVGGTDQAPTSWLGLADQAAID